MLTISKVLALLNEIRTKNIKQDFANYLKLKNLIQHNSNALCNNVMSILMIHTTYKIKVGEKGVLHKGMS